MRRGARRRRGGAGREPEVNRGPRLSRRGRQPGTGPRSCSRPSLPPCGHHAPVPGEWSCRIARWRLGPGPWGSRLCCAGLGPGASARVPPTSAPEPARRLSGWIVGFCFCFAQIFLPVFFLPPFKSLKLLRCQSMRFQSPA